MSLQDAIQGSFELLVAGSQQILDHSSRKLPLTHLKPPSHILNAFLLILI